MWIPNVNSSHTDLSWQCPKHNADTLFAAIEVSRGPWGCCHSFDHTHSACGVKGDPHVQSEDEQQAEMTRLTMKTTLGDLRCDSEDESSEPLWEARPITIMKPYIRSSVVMFGVCMMENKIFLYPLWSITVNVLPFSVYLCEVRQG